MNFDLISDYQYRKNESEYCNDRPTYKRNPDLAKIASSEECAE